MVCRPYVVATFASILVAGLSIVACGAPADGGTSEGVAGEKTHSSDDVIVPLPPPIPLPEAGTPVPPGAFPCGSIQCDAQAQYCFHVEGGAFRPGHPGGSFSCAPLPPVCDGNVTCACLEPRGRPGPWVESCADSGGGLTVTLLAP